MSFVDFKETSANNPGTTVRYGGNDLKEIMQILNGKVVASRRPRILNEWIWLDSFDVKAPAVAPVAPADTNTNRVYTDPTDFKLKIKKTGGSIRELETIDITDAMIAASGITTKSKLPGSIAYEDEANVFNANSGQESRGIGAELLKLYRPEAGLTDIDISYYWDDSIGTKTRYAVLRATPTNVTDTQETARFDIFLLTNGVFVRNLRLLNNGDLAILTTGTTGYTFLGTGLTGIRNFTWPDLSGKVATDTNANVFTAVQKTSVNSTVLQTYYAPKTTGSIQMLFNLNNASAAEVGYGRFQFRAVTNTAGAQEGEFGLNLWKAGTERNGLLYGYITGDEAFFAIYKAGFGSPAIQFRTTGLTAERIFTFPNLGGVISTAESTETVTGIKTWKAANISSKTAQAGAAELIQSWTIDDSVGASKIEILNASSADAVFSPWLRSFNLDTAAPALFFYGYIGNALDTGTDSVLRFDARKADNSAIATRTLFSFRNAGTEILAISPNAFAFAKKAMNNLGPISQSVPAQAGISESLQSWLIDDDALSRVELVNASSTDGLFAPWFRATQRISNAHPALYFYGYIDSTLDTGATPVLIFSSRRTGDTDITTRPLMVWRNNATTVFQINTKGDILHVILAQAGVGETLSEWRPSDVNSYIRLINASPTDARFTPMVRGRQVEDSTLQALTLEGRIEVGHDSGSAPVMAFDSRKSDDTAVASARPLFRFRNAGTAVLDIASTWFDFTNKELDNFYIMDKIGQYSCSSMTGVDGWGLLAGLISFGTFTKNLDATGSGHFWGTTTTIGSTAGVAKNGTVGAFIGWMRSAYLPFVRLQITMPAYTAGDSRFFFGWHTDAGTLAASDTIMDVNKGGIMLGYRSTDTNWQVFHGPGDGATAPTVVDTGLAIATAATGYFFQIRVVSTTNVVITIYSSGGTTALATVTVTTNLPTSSKALNFYAVMQNVTAVDKRPAFFSIGMRANT